MTWPGLAFTSIRLSDGKVLILKDTGTKALVELKEAAPLFEAVTSQAKSFAGRPIAVGHIYLARIQERNNQNMDMWLKILVLAHTPGQMVTMLGAIALDSATRLKPSSTCAAGFAERQFFFAMCVG